LPFFPDPRSTAPTRYKDRLSDHPMPGFTTELSCTNGSTDALLFQPSVHPTLHWSVGPTCHIRRRSLDSFLTLICSPPSRARRRHLRAQLRRISSRAGACASLRPPSCSLSAAAPPYRVQIRARAPLTPPRVSPPPPIPAVRRNLCSPAAA
jgi:hypothetical protein